ncbi:hypothetical protein T439DRAFT_352662 [Meredithblackwellia eburnea MCA 4105]
MIQSEETSAGSDESLQEGNGQHRVSSLFPPLILSELEQGPTANVHSATPLALPLHHQQTSYPPPPPPPSQLFDIEISPNNSREEDYEADDDEQHPLMEQTSTGPSRTTTATTKPSLITSAVERLRRTTTTKRVGGKVRFSSSSSTSTRDETNLNIPGTLLLLSVTSAALLLILGVLRRQPVAGTGTQRLREQEGGKEWMNGGEDLPQLRHGWNERERELRAYRWHLVEPHESLTMLLGGLGPEETRVREWIVQTRTKNGRGVGVGLGQREPPEPLRSFVGMMAVFQFAILTDRAFTLSWENKPFDLLFDSAHIDFSEPFEKLNPEPHPIFDNDSLIAGKWNSSIPNMKLRDHDRFWKRAVGNWKDSGPDWVRLISGNRGVVIRSWGYADARLPQLMQEKGMSISSSYTCLVDFLLRPKPEVLSFMTHYTSLFSLPTIFTVGIQIRTGDQVLVHPDQNIEQQKSALETYGYYFTCADQLAKTYASPSQKVVFYLLSDHEELKEQAVKKYPGQVVVTGIVPKHSDNKDEGTGEMLEDSLSSLAEMWSFMYTDYQIITRASGFAKIQKWEYFARKEGVSNAIVKELGKLESKASYSRYPSLEDQFIYSIPSPDPFANLEDSASSSFEESEREDDRLLRHSKDVAEEPLLPIFMKERKKRAVDGSMLLGAAACILLFVGYLALTKACLGHESEY